MSSSWEPEFSLPDRGVLEGFAGHAEPHRQDEGLDLEDFLQEATNVMNAPDVVVSFDQHGSMNTVYGNEDLGRIVWENGVNEEKSTTFAVSSPDGVAGYVARAMDNKVESSPEILMNDLIIDPETNELRDVGPYISSASEELSADDDVAAVADSVDATESEWL